MCNLVGIPMFYVVLLPSRQVVAACSTLPEAMAWAETYNAVMASSGLRAVVEQSEPARAAA